MDKDVLWTPDDLNLALKCEVPDDLVVTGISIDTRTISPGDLFIALAGERLDGHDYLIQALEAGVAAVLIDHIPEECDLSRYQNKLIRVANTFSALESLGHFARARFEGTVVAITGSVGKTGTKEALKTLIAPQARVFASPKSFNNHWGLPITLARLKKNTAFAILELGANHIGEIAKLTRMAKPHVAIITAVEPSHVGYFGSLEAIAQAKSEIFEGLQPEGTAIVSGFTNCIEMILKKAMDQDVKTILTTGNTADANAVLDKAFLTPDSSEVHATVLDEVLHYKVGIPGNHWVKNSLIALLTIKALGLDCGRAAKTCAQLTVPQGRGRLEQIPVKNGHATLIDESYNASPAAVHAALEVLSLMTPSSGGQKHFALGDMTELGPNTQRYHLELKDKILDAGVTRFYSVGPMTGALFDTLPSSIAAVKAETSQDLIRHLEKALKPGDILMVKGSFVMNMDTIVSHFMDETSHHTTKDESDTTPSEKVI